MNFQASREDCIVATVEDGIGRIVIDRPEKKNAFRIDMARRLGHVMSEMAGERELRAVVLSAAGPDFSAGGDLQEFHDAIGNTELTREIQKVNVENFRIIRSLPVPVIAAVNGFCFGAGFGLVAASDLRLASPDAMFSLPPARLGLGYPQEALEDLVFSLGPQLSRYMLYTAARLDAGALLHAGFLLRVVPSERLHEEAIELARNIAANAPLSVRAAKAGIHAVIDGGETLTTQAKALGEATLDSADFAEGRRAFIQRRPPRFTGQ